MDLDAANFDAVAGDRDEKMIEKRDLDSSRSRMLVAILEATLHDLVLPFNDKPAPQPELMDLGTRPPRWATPKSMPTST